MPKKPRVLSEKPPAVRARMRKSGRNLDRDVEMLYKKPVSDWDMEELARGRPRSSDGKFTGPRPTWITPVILRESQDRLRTLTRQELATYAGDAVRVMHQLMTNEDVDFDTGKPAVPASVKLSAATYVLDQTIGKATLPVEHSGNVVLDTLLADVLVTDETGTTAHPVIDGEVATDDEDDDDGGE